MRRLMRWSKGSGRFYSAIFVALLGSGVPGHSYAGGRVFYDGFEDGTTAKWSQDDYHERCRVVGSSVDGVGPRYGGLMAECNWDGTVAWNTPAAYSTLKLGTWNYQSEFLIRVWVRVAADCTRHNGAKVFRLFPDAGKTGDLIISPQLAESGGPMFVSWIFGTSAAPSYWGKGVPFGDGNWHKVEIYVKQNDPGVLNGVTKVWQDGVLREELANISSVAPGAKWNSLYLMSNWSNNPGWEHGANNHVYWDEVEIYSDLGAGGVGLLPDASMTVGSPVSAAAAPPKAPITLGVH